MLPECGEVLLFVGGLHPRIVVHEVTHAMFGIKRRRNIGDLTIKDGAIDATDEEWAVDAVAQMTSKVYHEINKLGLQ